MLVQLNSLALGGTQLNAIDLAIAVRDYGYTSILTGPADTLPENGVNLLDVAAERGVILEPYQRARGVLTGGASQMKERADIGRAEIIHLYGADAQPRNAFWGPCRAGRLPLVQTIYEMNVARNTYKHTSLIVGTGYLQDELADRPGPTKLISPPVDVANDIADELKAEQFKVDFNLPAGTLIAIVSRLDRWMKAYPIETAIRAMPYLLDTDATLAIVGTGTEENRLKDLGERLNMLSHRKLVYFTGALTDPRPAYAAADVVLGMGGSAARSLAFGRALIVQGEMGTAELFGPESARSLFRRSFWNPDPQTNAPERLADILRVLVDSPQMRQNLGEYGRKFAVENFSLDRMAAQLALVYDKCVDQYGRSAWLRDLSLEVPELKRSVSRRVNRRKRMHPLVARW